MFKLLALLFLVSSMPVLAAIDAYPFPNEELEERYDVLIAELRCPQCLNTNLAGSDAMIAQDLRRETHRMLLEGYSNEEILSFMHRRYGDFILYDPKISIGTVALWFGPPALLVVAFIILLRILQRDKVETSLTANEKAKIYELLEGHEHS